MGHAREAVLRRHRDQGVGGGVLRPTETVSRGPAQVSLTLGLHRPPIGPDVVEIDE